MPLLWGLAAPAVAQEKSFAEMVAKFTLLPGPPSGARDDSEMLAKAARAVGDIQRMELPQASKALNEALQLDARNSYLHFLNGFVYHLQARQGDATKNEMALEGYQQALRLDPGNWIAQEFLGLAYIDLKKFEPAKIAFSEVLLMAPDSSTSLYGLMVAAYLTGDAVTACGAADQFQKTATPLRPEFVRSSVSVYAACGDFARAAQMRATLAQLQPATAKGVLDPVDRRLAQWKVFYQRQDASLGTPPRPGEPLQLAQAFMSPSPEGLAAAEAPPAPATVQAAAPAPAAAQDLVNNAERQAPPDDGSPRMVLVDVVMVSTQELIATSKGINLLNALTLQLGSATAPAFSQTYSSNSVNGAPADVSTAITRAITVPALAYSLNIANANSTVNEVLARPTLAAMEGLPSEFFSGTNLNAGAVSTNSLGTASVIPVDKRFGVKLAVTPGFLPNGMVKLKVEAQRTFLNASTDSSGFAYRLEISETTANANVVMGLGDTLVLSGLSEKETSSSRTGVPVLQDVPLLQYFFSNKKTSDFQRSVLILITPRLPVYTSRAGRAVNGAQSESLKALREKLGFSGRTPSNVESILNHLKSTDLFREFRQGDVSLERWDRMHSTGERLQQALEFLYY